MATKMAVLASAIAALMFISVASAQTCADEPCTSFAVGDLIINRECFDFLDGATVIGTVCTLTKFDLQMNFIFKASSGYEITSASAGVVRDCAEVPDSDERFQRIRTLPGGPVDRTTLILPLSEITSDDGCCDKSLCFLFEAEIQAIGSPGTSDVYAPAVGDGCFVNGNGVVSCERTFQCDGCTGGSFCTDSTSAVEGRVDMGCSEELPYCDSGTGRNAGDDATGDVCRLCLGRGPKGSPDFNCPPSMPDCVTADGFEVRWTELGDACACLLTADDCGDDEVANMETCQCEEGVDSLCTDSEGGRAMDSGCSAELPFCDSGDGMNDGDGATGDVCRRCMGRGPNGSPDWNCPPSMPDCVTADGVEVRWSEMGDACVCLLTADDCGDNEVANMETCTCEEGVGSLCTDTEAGRAMDSGCSAELPYCDSGDGMSDGDGATGDVCRLCLGRGPTRSPDWNCSPTQPDCVTAGGEEVPFRELGDVCTCLLTDEECSDGLVADAATCLCVAAPCTISCTPPEVLNADGCVCECGLSVADCAAGEQLNPVDCACEATCTLTCDGNEVLNENDCICECSLVDADCTAPEVLIADTCSCGCDVVCDDPLILVPSTCGCLCPISEAENCTENQELNDVTCQCECALDSCLGQGILTGCECICPESAASSCEAPFEFSEANCDCECSLTNDDCSPGEFLDNETCTCMCQTTSDDCVGFEQYIESLCTCFCPSTASDSAQCELDGQEFREAICDCCGFAFTQVGRNLDGISAGDKFGSTVTMSANGQKFAATAPSSDGNVGHVRVYQDVWGTWQPYGQTIPGHVEGDAATNIQLSDDGTRLVMGYPNGGEAKVGSVRVFSFNPDTGMWDQLGETITGTSVGGRFGEWVSLSGDGHVVAVGEPLNSDLEYYGGKVQIWEHVHGEWKRLGSDFVSSTENAYLGHPVVMSQSGLRVAFSAHGSSEHVENGGKVQVFDFNVKTNDWEQVGKDLVGMSREGLAGVGLHMTPNGSRIVFGTSKANDETGLAQVYEEDNGAWRQIGGDLRGQAASDGAGIDVKIAADGNRVFISSKNADGKSGLKNVGHVRMFELDEGEWIRVSTAIEGVGENDEAGHSFAISHEGSRVVVGAGLNDGQGEDAGHVRVFELTFIPCEEVPTNAPEPPF